MEISPSEEMFLLPRTGFARSSLPSSKAHDLRCYDLTFNPNDLLLQEYPLEEQLVFPALSAFEFYLRTGTQPLRVRTPWI